MRQLAIRGVMIDEIWVDDPRRIKMEFQLFYKNSSLGTMGGARLLMQVFSLHFQRPKFIFFIPLFLTMKLKGMFGIVVQIRLWVLMDILLVS